MTAVTPGLNTKNTPADEIQATTDLRRWFSCQLTFDMLKQGLVLSPLNENKTKPNK